jgi:hypothetical protein
VKLPRSPTKTSPLWIRLLDDDLKYLQRVARKQRVSVAQAGREGLTRDIERQRRADERSKN